ncbi:uncharacterized protein LOC135392374 [Ornithodoros turicata]|uniref:uncharacterized protein LOC135392374 n=1 Tax=Ornithodoros turicata TaxID=34597 RepID=UPI0031397D22
MAATDHGLRPARLQDRIVKQRFLIDTGAQLLGTRHIHTTAYHPAANGLVERLHRQLKVALTAHANPAHWSQHLPFALLGIRSSVKEDLSCSSAELVYGSRSQVIFSPPAPPSPIHPTPPTSTSSMTCSAPSPRLRRACRRSKPFSSSRTSRTLRTCSSEPTAQATPYATLLRTVPCALPHPQTVVVDLSGKHDTVALDRVKPAYVSSVIPSNTYLDLSASSATLKPEAHTARRTVTWSLSSDRLQPDDALEGGAL